MVPTCSEYALTVGREFRQHDRPLMLQDEKQAAVSAVPAPRRIVVAGSDDALVVRGKLRIPNDTFVALEGGEQVTIGPVPDPRRVVAGSYDALAIAGKL